MMKVDPGTSGGNSWLVTFADVVMLLLTFFVMVYAMSTVDTGKWREVSAALSQQPQSTNAPVTGEPTAQYNIATVFRKRAINLDYLHAVIRDSMAADRRFDTARLHLLEDRLLISLPGELLFRPASAVLEAQAEGALFHLGGLLGNIINPIAVVGHAEPAHPEGSAYTSNWELTMGRAAAVANALRRSGYTRPVGVYGAADTRYEDLAGLPPERRAQVARRVDIVILPGGG